ncbi:ABC transporter ATP-binding protein [Halanaerobium sp. Z-7514]|uniref:ABC transporter ATP-binding protein n=1 Tax=Halanaerobium polyolivorans TaxID=2886943 RepID=A0AAW4WSF9_9FIRM|nr:ABC transporter ATP-binding protein [Halanaerobium polyolivorans]MCC3144025.1 ABC transporter ATP-binding protein [Halanaerobium polyolivorans]
MTENYILEIKDLKKKFGSFAALKGINLKVNRGEIIGLLGPNGAGKTTTIKIITGLLKADSGEINIFGENIISGLPTWIKEKIGVVFEESNLYYRLSAYDNLLFFARINGINKTKVEELLKEYKLYDVRKKAVKNFSKGMKKRLMICRSLLAEPEILILDEATGGLDPISAEIIRQKISKLKAEGKTVLLSTHYLEEADRLCDRVAFINQGSLIALDKPSVFKQNLKQDFIELKFAYDNYSLNKADLKKELSVLLKKGEEYKVEKDSFYLKIFIEEEVFNRLNKIAAQYKLLELKKREGDLQEVFKQINS